MSMNSHQKDSPIRPYVLPHVDEVCSWVEKRLDLENEIYQLELRLNSLKDVLNHKNDSGSTLPQPYNRFSVAELRSKRLAHELVSSLVMETNVPVRKITSYEIDPEFSPSYTNYEAITVQKNDAFIFIEKSSGSSRYGQESLFVDTKYLVGDSISIPLVNRSGATLIEMHGFDLSKASLCNWSLMHCILNEALGAVNSVEP